MTNITTACLFNCWEQLLHFLLMLWPNFASNTQNIKIPACSKNEILLWHPNAIKSVLLPYAFVWLHWAMEPHSCNAKLLPAEVLSPFFDQKRSRVESFSSLLLTLCHRWCWVLGKVAFTRKLLSSKASYIMSISYWNTLHIRYASLFSCCNTLNIWCASSCSFENCVFNSSWDNTIWFILSFKLDSWVL